MHCLSVDSFQVEQLKIRPIPPIQSLPTYLLPPPPLPPSTPAVAHVTGWVLPGSVCGIEVGSIPKTSNQSKRSRVLVNDRIKLNPHWQPLFKLQHLIAVFTGSFVTMKGYPFKSKILAGFKDWHQLLEFCFKNISKAGFLKDNLYHINKHTMENTYFFTKTSWKLFKLEFL